MMKKLLVVALVGLFATSARADTIAMINVADGSTVGVTLNPGDVFTLGIQVGVHVDATAAINFVNAFLDAINRDGGSVQVVGASFVRDNWSPGEDRSAGTFFAIGGIRDEDVPPGSFPMPIDGLAGNTNEASSECPECPLDVVFAYHLVSKNETSGQGLQPGETAVIEHVLIQALTPGTVDLYWENPGTSVDPVQRPVRRPTVSVSGPGKPVLGSEFGTFNFDGFQIDDGCIINGTTCVEQITLVDENQVLLVNGTSEFDVAVSRLNNENPFSITILPEPATMALLGFGALALLRRRRTA